MVYRKDRKHGEGGVFIAVKNCYPSSSVAADSDCETIWARVSLPKSKNMFIGSFYRPPNVTKSPFDGLASVLDVLDSGNRDKLITFGGDFNASGINWDGHSVNDDCPNKSLCQELLALTTKFGPTQTQRDPTRENNILDLHFTNNSGLVKGTYTIPRPPHSIW